MKSWPREGRNSRACCIRISNFSFYSRFYFLGVINIFDHLTSCNMKHAHTCTCISHGYLLIPTEFTRSHDALAKKLASMRILLLHLNHAFHLFFTVTCQRQWHTRRYPDTYTKSNHNMPLLSPSPPSNQGAHEDDIDRFNCSLMMMAETSIFMAPTRKLYFVWLVIPTTKCTDGVIISKWIPIVSDEIDNLAPSNGYD